MATRPITRFTVRIGEAVRELCAVRQRVNGDIVIVVDRSAGRPDDSDQPAARGLRISAHVAKDAAATPILYQVRWADGSYGVHAVSVSRRRGDLIWPVMTHSVADLTDARYATPAVPGETIVSLGSYDPRWTVLTYSIVISTPRLDLGGLGQWNAIGRDFARFRVTALWSFMRVPSFQEGGIVFGANGPAIMDDDKAPRARIEERQSCSRAQLVSILRESSMSAADNYVFRLSHFMQASGLELPEEISVIARRFEKEPWQPGERRA